MNEPWTKEEEVNQLQQRFDSLKSTERVSQAAFARANSMPGGASMITQHLKMTRPISLEHALVYARGFRCSLAEISPRLARLVAEGQATTGSTPALVPEPAQINERRAAYRVVSLESAVEGLARHFESVDGYDKATAISLLSTLANSPDMHAVVAAGLKTLKPQVRGSPSKQGTPAQSVHDSRAA